MDAGESGVELEGDGKLEQVCNAGNNSVTGALLLPGKLCLSKTTSRELITLPRGGI